jgi:hypothetical protein
MILVAGRGLSGRVLALNNYLMVVRVVSVGRAISFIIKNLADVALILMIVTRLYQGPRTKFSNLSRGRILNPTCSRSGVGVDLGGS